MKRILLAVCGLSPQVITETLYVLHQEDRLVDGIRILTTRQGKDECNATLLSPEDGQYYRFLDEHDIDPGNIDFSHRHVRSVADENGREIDDIATEEENEIFLKACMEEAFQLTRYPETAVFFSLAGGRKTMGACLALAAQFYARAQDRIFHVLVSPSEFESSREFFYPPPEARYVKLRNSQGNELYMKTDEARISLVPMPFVSMRNRLEDAMLKSPEKPESLLLSLVRESRPTLVLDLSERRVAWKDVEVDMAPARLALYAFFAIHKKDASCEQKSCRGCTECALRFEDIDERYMQDIATLYDRIAVKTREEAHRGIRSLEREALNQYRSKINADLMRAFGPYEAPNLQIQSFGPRGDTRYLLPLDRSRIRVIF